MKIQHPYSDLSLEVEEKDLKPWLAAGWTEVKDPKKKTTSNRKDED